MTMANNSLILDNFNLYRTLTDQLPNNLNYTNLTNGNQSNDYMYDYDLDDMWDYYDIQERISRIMVKPSIVLTFILGGISLVANTCTIVAISQVKSRWTSLFRFMLSLMMSDILITTSVILHIVNIVFNPQYQSGMGPYRERLVARCTYMAIKALNTMALNISLLNLMGMAIDHYIAILSPLRYYSILDAKRSSIFIFSLWIIAFVTGYSDFISPLFNLARYNSYIKRNFNYCEGIWISKYQEEYTTFVIALICFCVMLTIYLRIYCSVKQKRRESVVLFDSHSSNGRKSSQESRRSFQWKSSKMKGGKRNTRALYTTLFILGTFMICWLPMCCFQLSMVIFMAINKSLPDTYKRILVSVNHYLYILLLVNTICDPVIYAIRIGEVRQSFRAVLGKIFKFMGRSSSRKTKMVWKHKTITSEISSFSISEHTELTSKASIKRPSIKETNPSTCLIENE